MRFACFGRGGFRRSIFQRSVSRISGPDRRWRRCRGFCQNRHYSKNIEIADKKAEKIARLAVLLLKEVKSIEAGNIFTLGTKFSAQMKANFTDENGNEKPMIMGCYGIGLGRIMGSVVEVHNDEKGIIWLKSLPRFISI